MNVLSIHAPSMLATPQKIFSKVCRYGLAFYNGKISPHVPKSR